MSDPLGELLRTGEVPFIHVQVLLNRKEYEEMRAAAHLTARGTCSEVIRQRLGLYGTPYGYIKWNRMRWKALQ